MAAGLQLADFDAVTFDFYGTIVNWEPEINTFLKSWTQNEGCSIPDTALLETYDRLRQPIQAKRPVWSYPEVLRRTLDAMASELGCSLPSELRHRFGNIAADHRPFTDSLEALEELRSRGKLLGALSNIDEDSFAKILQRLGFTFDIKVTAERVSSYKPDKAHFLTALADLGSLGIEKERVLHVAQSKRADIVPATELGLTCVWVDRPGHVFGRQGGGADAVQATYHVSSLAELLKYS